jgi:hypothetical protein
MWTKKYSSSKFFENTFFPRFSSVEVFILFYAIFVPIFELRSISAYLAIFGLGEYLYPVLVLFIFWGLLVLYAVISKSSPGYRFSGIYAKLFYGFLGLAIIKPAFDFGLGFDLRPEVAFPLFHWLNVAIGIFILFRSMIWAVSLLAKPPLSEFMATRLKHHRMRVKDIVIILFSAPIVYFLLRPEVSPLFSIVLTYFYVSIIHSFLTKLSTFKMD